MKSKYVYEISSAYTDRPCKFEHFRLSDKYPQYENLIYDLNFVAKKPMTSMEKSILSELFPADSLEEDVSPDINVLRDAAEKSVARKVFLNGFRQEHFDYIAPFIKDKVEVLYLFKCPKIKDLSALSEFSRLECVLMTWNNSLESLWDMRNNKELRALSFENISKLAHIETLKDSNLEYVSFDSIDNSSNRKQMLFDRSVFDEMPNLKHLRLVYSRVFVDY